MWRVGFVRAPMETLVSTAAVEAQAVTWLAEQGPLRFLADPFGVWREGKLYVFVETYDYRDRVGAIDVLTFDAELRLIAHEPALREPWHLSYPFIVEVDGETFMLPRRTAPDGLTLYRAEDFPRLGPGTASSNSTRSRLTPPLSFTRACGGSSTPRRPRGRTR
jgi:hypothetical protein